MLEADYGKGTSLSSNANRFTEKVTGYDKNGNILALQRYGQTSESGYGLIDNLTFTLDGNRLNQVDDAVTASAYNGSFEFKDAVKQADEYTKKIGVTRSCYTSYTYVLHASYERATRVTRTCDYNSFMVITALFF